MDEGARRNALLFAAMVIIAAVIFYLEGGFGEVGGGIGGGVVPAFDEEGVPIGPHMGNRAPEFVLGGEWINSEPLTMRGLRGKVVLVDFWTYTCINCLRTLPYLNSWNEKYADDGLVIVGVHTPEFNFERDAGNVRRAMEENGGEYAVMQDNDYRTWKAWDNHYWPHKFLVDKDGIVRYDHIGEGGYEETESKIIELLAELGAEVSGDFELPDVEQENLQRTTPEIYAGYWRGEALGNSAGKNGEAFDYADAGGHELHKFYLQGRWNVDYQNIKYEGEPEAGYVHLSYYARSVNGVMRPVEGGSYEAGLLLDGEYMTAEEAGKDVKFGEGGRSYVLVDSDRLYNLVRTADYGAHELSIVVDSNEFSLYAYTFG